MILYATRDDSLLRALWTEAPTWSPSNRWFGGSGYWISERFGGKWLFNAIWPADLNPGPSEIVKVELPQLRIGETLP